jgi:hypothetical protein
VGVYEAPVFANESVVFEIFDDSAQRIYRLLEQGSRGNWTGKFCTRISRACLWGLFALPVGESFPLVRQQPWQSPVL